MHFMLPVTVRFLVSIFCTGSRGGTAWTLYTQEYKDSLSKTAITSCGLLWGGVGQGGFLSTNQLHVTAFFA